MKIFAKFNGLHHLQQSCTQQLWLLLVICGCSVLIFYSYTSTDSLPHLSFQTAGKFFSRDALVLTPDAQDSRTPSKAVHSFSNLFYHKKISSNNHSPESEQNFLAKNLSLDTRIPKNESSDKLEENYTNLDVKNLPLVIANQRKKKVDVESSNSTTRPNTWLQLIQLGIAQLNAKYISNEVTIIPDALPPKKTSGNSTLKKILYWNEFYGSKDFDFGIGQEPFRSAGCPVSSCYATYNKTLFPLEDIDAIIWHGRSKHKSLPPIRYPHTRYVFFMVESPEHTQLGSARYEKIFNYTMTYRTDSDIYNPYGIFVPLAAPRLELLNKNYASKKTAMAVWLVSNCNAPSQRKKVVKYLQKFLKVDILGKCGKKTCPKVKDHNPDECFRLIEAKYKFYFAFENSLCDQYVTEKFFGAARFDILPVVYGLGEYEQLAPPHSYINVLDFPSIRHLAEHLLYLDKNDTAYSEYFRWKARFKAEMRYKTKVTPEYKEISWCQLCSKLHSDNSITVYENLDNWRQHHNCIKKKSPYFSNFLNGVDVSKVL
ncbi:Fucosyltransferase N-terminal [Trinorchestia longiramus]|nr:Fucosyltransferase N-terminal [Trinorchestia longiramus]